MGNLFFLKFWRQFHSKLGFCFSHFLYLKILDGVPELVPDDCKILKIFLSGMLFKSTSLNNLVGIKGISSIFS